MPELENKTSEWTKGRPMEAGWYWIVVMYPEDRYFGGKATVLPDPYPVNVPGVDYVEWHRKTLDHIIAYHKINRPEWKD